MVDETTTISNNEQVAICCRRVDVSFKAHEGFIDLYVVCCTLHWLGSTCLGRTVLNLAIQIKSAH